VSLIEVLEAKARRAAETNRAYVRVAISTFGAFKSRQRHGRNGEGFRMPARSDLSARVRAGVRKPPRKEPAGRWVGVCRLWGFERAAAWVGGALAGGVDGGPTIAVASLSPRLRPAARFWRDRRCSRWFWRDRGGSEATPEARRRNRREVQ
jgi:hypothetical protein